MAVAKKKQGKRFDHLWHDLLAQHAAATKAFNTLRGVTTRYRRAAYRFTKTYMTIEQEHHNEFLAMCASVKRSPEDWIEDHFEVIEQMGEDRRRLMTAVEKGMTEKEYVAQGPAWLVKRNTEERERTPILKTDVTRPGKKSEPLTPEQIGSLVKENHELRKELAIISRAYEDVLKRLAKAERALQGPKLKVAKSG